MAPHGHAGARGGYLADDVTGGHVGTEGLGGGRHEAGGLEGLRGLLGGAGQVGHGHGLDAQGDDVADGGTPRARWCPRRILADDVTGGHVGTEGLGGGRHEAGGLEGLRGLLGGAGQVGHGHGLDAQGDDVADGGSPRARWCPRRDPG